MSYFFYLIFLCSQSQSAVNSILLLLQEFKGWVAGVKDEAVDTTGASFSFAGGILNILTS